MHCYLTKPLPSKIHLWKSLFRHWLHWNAFQMLFQLHLLCQINAVHILFVSLMISERKSSIRYRRHHYLHQPTGNTRYCQSFPCNVWKSRLTIQVHHWIVKEENLPVDRCSAAISGCCSKRFLSIQYPDTRLLKIWRKNIKYWYSCVCF